ncbi:uncharacterized protein B0H18DRAFT_602795 [Fomitopsis serialis]|uniref:uncharacterized protein n=1 Tax=Fomitopsis serialis TaxID=139415 RepID=UPI0020081531|nr:uncharacterized protein B0H18DRAFT_602795 [Neoantrodia serialis]KAH9933821.1 hypothetical protein B0H18DRAFT_602795 [Neoantrodia serialis]
MRSLIDWPGRASGVTSHGASLAGMRVSQGVAHAGRRLFADYPLLSQRSRRIGCERHPGFHSNYPGRISPSPGFRVRDAAVIVIRGSLMCRVARCQELGRCFCGKATRATSRPAIAHMTLRTARIRPSACCICTPGRPRDTPGIAISSRELAVFRVRHAPPGTLDTFGACIGHPSRLPRRDCKPAQRGSSLRPASCRASRPGTRPRKR